MADSMLRFDALYAVSDLHMGGAPGFQIFRQGVRLGRLIRHLADAHDASQKVALVLNGDVIDSLAEEIGGYIAVTDAEKMMQRIFTDPAFSPVWDGLETFVSKSGRTLIVVIGNHDIELALPLVERSIRNRLTRGDEAAEGRIIFATQGAGFTCNVGDSRVFCIHGNEVDDWNLVDYSALSALAQQQNAGAPIDVAKWSPNAGTRLVKDVMNQVKRKHPWIDLLKPETQAALGVLMVMDPNQVDKLDSALPIVWAKVRGNLKSRGLLSANGSPDVGAASGRDVALDELLGPNLRGGVHEPTAAVDKLLLEAERSVRGGGRDAVAAGDGTLGLGRMLFDRLRGVDAAESLRLALKDWLEGDKTFELEDRDSTFNGVMKNVGPDVDVVITGHTHLERAIQDGHRLYYNCGTWIRLLRFNDQVLNDSAAFKGVYDVLCQEDMSAIDAATVPGANGTPVPFVLDLTSVVRIVPASNGVTGVLCHVADDGASVRLDEVASSKFGR